MAKFRQEHGLELGSPVDLEPLLKQLQVRTVFKPLDSSFSGMAMKYANKSYMLVNSDHSRGKQNFTIAHELYHLFIQHNFVPHASQAGRFGSQTDPEERNADWFAALLLMPASYIYVVASEAGEMEPRIQLTLPTVVKLEQDFQCSRQALLVRLENLRLITAAQKEEWAQSPAASARQFDYPTDLYRSTPQREAIGDYVALASRLFDKERLSETHYAGLLADFGVDIHSLGTETPD
ncbi:ImmA/IrrE family metallo-endopeptidase [Hymenobacter metallicola]|uniref:ImmA/IrrE family metallo-endopeptidase n=1 Tax=Hymenobacter metallicola TaxID=2563114 RepID=UPI0021D01B7D|nr:ImmA/IrrE family metallo-endopeptidase [Hymenobacter metallicola]